MRDFFLPILFADEAAMPAASSIKSDLQLESDA